MLFLFGGVVNEGVMFRWNNSAVFPVIAAIVVILITNYIGVFEKVFDSRLAYWSTTLVVVNIYILVGFSPKDKTVGKGELITIGILLLAFLGCVTSLIGLNKDYLEYGCASNIITSIVIAADLLTFVYLFVEVKLQKMHYILAVVWYLGLRIFLHGLTGF